MDTTKWKSVLVPIEVYKEIKEHSVVNGRTISGQLRIMFDVYSKDDKFYFKIPASLFQRDMLVVNKYGS